MTNNDFFFCYNKRLSLFLTEIKRIDYITVAISPTTNKTYAMFYKTHELQTALDEYKSLRKL